MGEIDLASVTAFAFTERRIEAALNLAANGMAAADKSGRRLWRDSGSSDGLMLRAGRTGGVFMWRAKRGGRVVRERIGDATRMKLTDARRVAKRLAGGDDTAKPKPIRMDTSGPRVADVWAAYMAESRAGQFSIGSRRPRESTLRSYEQLYEPHIGRPRRMTAGVANCPTMPNPMLAHGWGVRGCTRYGQPAGRQTSGSEQNAMVPV